MKKYQKFEYKTKDKHETLPPETGTFGCNYNPISCRLRRKGWGKLPPTFVYF